jgi:2-polyprenyl-6-hydroxyphenyl methylase/3-demethylubiquinone-9 3-methyltransferase
MNKEEISFSFGQNWHDYATSISEDEYKMAQQDIENWLGSGKISGKSVVDIGSGSGIQSLGFYRLGARKVCSFDYDPKSVTTTRSLWESEGCPKAWVVTGGSVLDSSFLQEIGKFDIVYSWGVLHHTGAMWDAIRNACGLVLSGGILFLALYAEGPRYSSHLALKRKFNKKSKFGKKMMVYRWIANIMLGRLLKFQNPLTWNEKNSRGMNVYHDIVDWLGGLPYEVAAEDEVVVFCRKLGFILERIKVKSEGACSIYVFSLP